MRFNPNLYNEGKVCLSLLGTWPGEPWNPRVSNLLQVCNSILFLIFVDKPYFNEPGYAPSEGTPSGDQASLEYNRVIQKATVKFAMVDMVRSPPACFAEVVRRHFKYHIDSIEAKVGEWIEASGVEKRSLISSLETLKELVDGLPDTE